MEINKNIENELNLQFPKGNKGRGKALVLVAIAHMELNKQSKKMICPKCKKGELTKHSKDEVYCVGCNTVFKLVEENYYEMLRRKEKGNDKVKKGLKKLQKVYGGLIKK